MKTAMIANKRVRNDYKFIEQEMNHRMLKLNKVAAIRSLHILL